MAGIAQESISRYLRDTGEKLTMRKAGLGDDLPALLLTIQSSMYAKAKSELTEHLRVVTDFPAFLKGLEEKCQLQAPFCGDKECEETIRNHDTFTMTV